MNIPDFIAKWKSSTLTERAAAQSWFTDLCRALDVPTPTDIDTEGATYTFERGASKTSGGNGWADVWMRGHFAWEFKGKHADLAKAYRQLRDYIDDLESPPLLVVSDFSTIIVRTNFNNTPTQKHIIRLEELGKPANIDLLRALWDDPARLRPDAAIVDVTTKAANELGTIALGLRDRGVEPHRAAHFTVELLFCFFAEDIGLLPRGLFSQLLEFGIKQPAVFNNELEKLLATMRDGGFYNLQSIPRFDGGLFEAIVTEPLTANEIAALASIGLLDWEDVEPAIFGTLFERSLDPSRRGQLGAHYTGVQDIERVIDPVVMQPLLRRWDEVRAEAEPVAETWITARKNGTPQKRNAAEKAFRAVIDGFLTELRNITVLDPACGSGNFLYVALRKLMDIEKDVIEYAAAQGMTRMFPEVSPRQVLGLEINEYAVEITRTVVWIGFLQWRVMHGFGVGDPVLQPLDTIREQDALLDLSDPDHPKEAEWPAADFIVGNPPFLGGNKVRQELGDTYLDALFEVFDSRIPKFADLCCYFFEKARKQIEIGTIQRAGFLATNSIRGGANREVLNRIKASGDIYFAWSDEPWILDGAAVRISVVAFDDGSESVRTLDGFTVSRINSDLTSSVDITTAQRLAENANLCFMGPSPKAPFDIDAELAEQFLREPININGRPNSDVVVPVVSAVDIAQRSRNRWTIDFGLRDEHLASMYEAPFEYVKKMVYPIRSENRRESYRLRWWQYAEPRPGLRTATVNLNRKIATPGVSKHRLFTWRPIKDLCNQGTLVFARDDDYFFGVLHSRAHEIWSLRMGTWLGKGNDPRYTPTTCFETFPFPWPPGTEPVDDPRVIAIAAAAKDLDDKRRAWLDPPGASAADLKKRTLTNLYNERPTWLRNLHARLDRAVWDAYAWPSDEIPAEVGEEVILERMLEFNSERSSAWSVKAEGIGASEEER